MKLPTAKQITMIIAHTGIKPTPALGNTLQWFRDQRAKKPNVGSPFNPASGA